MCKLEQKAALQQRAEQERMAAEAEEGRQRRKALKKKRREMAASQDLAQANETHASRDRRAAVKSSQQLAIAAAEIDPAADLDEVALPYNFEVLLFSQFKFSNSQLLSCTQDLPQGTTKPVIPLPARPSFAAWGVPLGSKSELAPVNVHKERPPEADKLIELGASEVDNMTSKVEANGDRGSSSGCESGANVAGIDGNNFAGGAESGYGFLMAEPLTRPVTRETPDTHENLGNQDAHDTMVESFTKPTIGSVLPYQEDPLITRLDVADGRPDAGSTSSLGTHTTALIPQQIPSSADLTHEGK